MATNNKLTKEEELEKNKVNGVDDATANKAYNSTFTPSTDQQNAQSNSGNALSRVEDLTSKDNIVSQDTWDTLNSTFQKPTAVTEADAYIKTQLSKIQSGKTSYSDQVKDMMAQIQGREKFSYDVDSDPLFQQALASAMSSGKQAMQDTIGQASALTGGYGSTYATTAGNQAYNSFIEDAYDNLPQYYQMAMEAYQMEGDEMYRQLGMLTDADDREYNRNVTAYDATYQHRNQMYNEAYQLYRDSKTDAYNMANLQLSEHGQLVSDAYNYYNASSDYANTLYNREYQSWADQVAQAQQYAQMLNSDYWNQTNYDRNVYESDRAYDRGVYESDRSYDRGVYESDRAYDRGVLESDRNYNRGVLESDRAYNYQAEQDKIDNEYRKETFEYQKEQDAKAAIYDGYINPDDVEVDDNGNIVKIEGYNLASNSSSENAPSVSGFKTNNGDNFEVTIGKKSYKVENHGIVNDQTTIDNLKKATSYGNLKVYNNTVYITDGTNYYKLGNRFNGSGHNDLLLELQK